MRLLELIFGAPARVFLRRRVRRANWGFNHELTTYVRALARVEGPVCETGGNPSDPMPRRAAEALPRVKREYARFRKGSAEIDDARDAILRRLADPKTPRVAAASARKRFEPLVARHPTPEALAEQETDWQRGLARLETWAQRDPEHVAAVAAAAKRRAELSGRR